MDIFDAIKQFFGIDSTSKPDVPDDPCNAVPACVAARDTLQAARSGVTSVCDAIRISKGVASAIAAVIFSPWYAVAIVVALAAQVILDGLAGAVAAALIVAWVALFLVYLGALLVVRGLAPTLVQRQLDFAAALKDVLADCSPECRGDISPPNCQLQ
jgi:hypothetical protein